MKKIQQTLKKLWEDESGQGTLEYILLAAIIGAIAFAFRKPIMNVIKTNTEEMGEKLKEAIGAISYEDTSISSS